MASVRLPELMCDGILISNACRFDRLQSVGACGTIVPLSANLLPLTPISAFRPRRWRGALLPSTAKVIKFEVLEADKRPTAAVADFTEVRDVVSVVVSEDRSISITVLFTIRIARCPNGSSPSSSRCRMGEPLYP